MSILEDRRYLLVVPKVWGVERWICNNDLYCGKLLELKPGFESSLHYHKAKDETFHVLEGSCILLLNGDELNLGQGATVRIQAGARHSFWTADLHGCKILEISTHHDDKDTVRIRASRQLTLALPAEESAAT